MDAVKSELRVFALALQFLTRIPVTGDSIYSAEGFHASVRHYPLVGVLVGITGAIVFFAATQFWPPVIAVLLSTVATVLVTGAFHEDGLTDMFDGVGGGTSRERSLEIMKDSRIGAYGMLAALLVIALKVTSLTLMPAITIIYVLIAAHCLSRLSAVLVIASSQYARGDGTGKPVATGVSAVGLSYAIATGLACCGLVWFRVAPFTMLAGVAGLLGGHLLSRLIYERKLRGYTGDCLGATQQLSEVGFYLGVLACL